MDWLTLDFETHVTRRVNLQRMTLWQYLAESWITLLTLAENDDDVMVFRPPFDIGLVRTLREYAENPNVCWVAHNAAFDVRVARRGVYMDAGLRVPLEVPQPAHVDCTLEQAMAAWPNQPGGYSLKALGESLPLYDAKGNRLKKIEIDLQGKYTQEELDRYGANDTEMCRAIHRLALARLDPKEVEIGRLANSVRELHFEVDPRRVGAAVDAFIATAASAAQAVLSVPNMEKGGSDAFGGVELAPLGVDESNIKLVKGSDGKLEIAPNRKIAKVKSVKPHTLKKMLLENMGFDTQTISLKKINPSKLVGNPDAEKVIREAGRANKALSHQRRVGVFAGVAGVDAELGYFRAHTGRFSSPSVGKGLNLHNLPKHDKAIARPIREIFRLPKEVCFVRADFANVEYRIEGWLSNCQHIINLFTKNLLADPYVAYWLGATGQAITKKDPARQVAKKSVLGLGFLMGLLRWCAELMIALSDPTFKVTLADMDAMCKAKGWGPVTDKWAKTCATKLNAPWQVVTVAYQTRQAFNDLHPEFGRLARWLETVCADISAALPGTHEAVIDRHYAHPAAPDRNRLDILTDSELGANTVRVKCGPWSRTIAWRDIGIHDTHFGKQFSSVQAGNKGYRALTRNILIENVTQSAARNGMCLAMQEMAKLGWPYLPSIHDELLVVCPRNRVDVLRARDDLLKVVGPGNSLGFDWAVCIDPSEINVSGSMWEEEMGRLLPPASVDSMGEPKYHASSEWWARLAAGQDELLDTLP